jgi:hypothetical protein
MSHETTVEVALVVESGGQGGFRKVVTRPNQPSCQRDAPLQNIGVRSQAERARKSADQLVAAETCFPRERRECEWCRRIIVNPGSCPSDAGGRALRACRSAGRVFAQPSEKLQKSCFGRNYRARRGIRHCVRKHGIEYLANLVVRKHWCGEHEGWISPRVNVLAGCLHQLRIQIKEPPGPGLLVQRAPIVHFTRIDADDISRACFNLSPVAPRSVRSRVDDAYAVLIVSVSREGPRGRGDHGIYSGQRKPVKTYVLTPRFACHGAPMCLNIADYLSEACLRSSTRPAFRTESFCDAMRSATVFNCNLRLASITSGFALPGGGAIVTATVAGTTTRTSQWKPVSPWLPRPAGFSVSWESLLNSSSRQTDGGYLRTARAHGGASPPTGESRPGPANFNESGCWTGSSGPHPS